MYCGKHEYHQRLKLIEGFARESGFKGLLPIAINSICLNFKDDVVYWTINKESISKLINGTNKKIINQTIFQIGNMTFQLFLQNKSGNIILRLLGTLPSNSNIDDFNLYFELYCIQTEAQFKQTYERTHYGVYDGSWTDHHLNIQQIKSNKYNKLTFAVHIKKLSNNLSLSQISRCHYKWDLNKYLSYSPFNDTKECKVYSPNFGADNLWCLWYKNVDKYKNNDSICIGIQLLNLPFIFKNGILFKCRFEYGYNDEIYDEHEYEFNYYLNLDQHSVEVATIIKKPTLWIKIEISPIDTASDEYDSETSDDDTEESDDINSSGDGNNFVLMTPSPWTQGQDWCFRE